MNDNPLRSGTSINDGTINDSDASSNILVLGDNTTDRFIYVEGQLDTQVNLRETWVNASQFWTVDLEGGSGSLLQLLNASQVDAIDPCPVDGKKNESIYVLTRQNAKWYVGQAIVAGDREYPSGKLECSTANDYGNTPAVIIDFNLGWLKDNKDSLNEFFSNRSYIVRTHDPLSSDWQKIRANGINSGIWFSPIQDMANGSLWFASNWEHLHSRVLAYLKSDPTIWENGKWKHHIVVQIQYDGALIFSPNLNNDGELLIFKGDQPDSFKRKGYGTVVAAGIVFVYSLVEECLLRDHSYNELTQGVRKALARIRKMTMEGYVGPTQDVNGNEWKLGMPTNLPLEQIRDVETKDIITYGFSEPLGSMDVAFQIVTGNDEELREKTVFTLGDLITSSPEYAQTLLRLTSRLDNHVASGKGVFSYTIFGGPGSGKSFVAEQIANSIDPNEEKFERQIFNLSQLADPTRLVDAFKKIQSIGLKGKIPFILWDEFDSFHNGSQCGWISSFLMPMQDAKYFDGMSNQNLGKCIFVFVGGTFKDDEEFGVWTSKDEAKSLKGPDFHSRLDSSVTVPAVSLAKTSITVNDSAKLVRAVMLRIFLKKHKHLTHITEEVLAYLLHVPLQYGIRSLQRIVTASELRKTTCFNLYHLPPQDVLQLHVDPSATNLNRSVEEYLAEIDMHPPFTRPPLELRWNKQ